MADADLALLFVGALGDPTPRPDRSRLERALVDACRNARGRWPAVQVSDQRFVEHLARLTCDEADPIAAVERMHSADTYLACACALGDPAAIAAFDGLLAELVDRTTSPGYRDDVGQHVRERLLVATGGLPRIADYRGRGRLSSWVRVSLARAEVDAIRATRAEDRAHAGWQDTIEAEATPELDYLKSQYRADFERAFTQSLHRLSSHHRNVLRQKLLLGMSLAQIAQLHGVTDRTVKRWLAAARAGLFDLTREALMRRLEISPSEFESIMRLIDSQMDLSVRRLLRPA